MKRLVNFLYDKSKNKYILRDDGYVLADEPFAILDTDLDIDEPLVRPVIENGFEKLMVVDKNKWESTHKVHFFDVINDKGDIEERPNGRIKIELTKDIDISKFKYENGKLVPKNETQTEI